MMSTARILRKRTVHAGFHPWVWAVMLVGLSFQSAPAADTQITPSLTAQTQYNDNIFFERTDTYSDTLVTVTPGLALTRRTERSDSGLSMEIPIIRYVDLDELDAVDQRYSGRLRYRWSPQLTTSLQGGYVRDSQPDRDILETGLVIDDTTRNRVTAGVSGEYSFSEAMSAGLAYAFEDFEYTQSAYSDSTSHNVYVILTRDLERFFVNTRGRLTLGAGRYDFDNDTVDSYSAMVGAEKRLTERFRLSGDIGGRHTRREFDTGAETEDAESSGGIGRAALSYQGEYARASVSFYRDIATSSGTTGAVERTYAVMDVGRRFTRALWGHVSAGYYLNDSNDQDLADQEVDQTTWRVSPYLSYTVSPNLKFEASYSYTWIEYHTDDTDAERNLVFFRIVYAHPLLK